METRRDERIGQLLQALKRSDKLHLKEAATLLGVSEMTIRRDLNNHDAPVVLLGGYIVLEPRSANHYLISDQKSRLVDEKTSRRPVGGESRAGASDHLFRLRYYHAVDH
ncbi:Deoxyribose operon repressor, DeoR family [Citrobacter freundii]|uniref:Deoxyribose operon repressor, DeoR family n=1 Tax=Citrobacter freundii TaxID=546 RepID=A0A7G2IPD4_CITFR|nr:Deoxyribose operon repressor, DeoR family [Citrobacter freundii]